MFFHYFLKALNLIMFFSGEKKEEKKHLRGSTQATINPLATILAAVLQALVSTTYQGSIVALILPPLCFLYYHHVSLVKRYTYKLTLGLVGAVPTVVDAVTAVGEGHAVVVLTT